MIGVWESEICRSPHVVILPDPAGMSALVESMLELLDKARLSSGDPRTSTQ